MTDFSGYVNPLKSVRGLKEQRIDQGVDFTGHGPVRAIGDATILDAQGNNAGWPGGGWISYTLNSGPAAGLDVYVAESVRPTVHPGQHVHGGQKIGNMFSFIETGWAGNASQPESQLPEAGSISGANLPGGGTRPTRIGLNFDEMLMSLGVPGAPNRHLAPGGKLPPKFSNMSGNIQTTSGNPISNAISSGFTDILLHALGINSSTDLKKLLERVGLMIFGAVLVILGLVIFLKGPKGVTNAAVFDSGKRRTNDREDRYRDTPYKSEAGKRQYEEYQDRETVKAYEKSHRRGAIDKQERAETMGTYSKGDYSRAMRELDEPPF